MNKKLIIGIIIVVVIVFAIALGYVLLNNNKNIKDKNLSNNSAINGKTLVVYYSATGSTKKVAEEVSKNLNADLFEIVPEDIYTREDLDWTNESSRVSKEHDDESLRDVKLKNTKVENWESYDTVLIGYPIWWGGAAWPIDTFVKENNFNNKTVIPFCTSASSSLGQSGERLEGKANGGNWLEGYRFSSGVSNSDIKTWTDSLK